jgi:hypothetical protein
MTELEIREENLVILRMIKKLQEQVIQLAQYQKETAKILLELVERDFDG